jgi:hypothetical protein
LYVLHLFSCIRDSIISLLLFEQVPIAVCIDQGFVEGLEAMQTGLSMPSQSVTVADFGEMVAE